VLSSVAEAAPQRGAAALALGVALGVACEGVGNDDGRCGPSTAVVARVIDGDTVELDDGQRVRYLMIDTPEITNGKMDCFGAEARDFNRGLVEGKTVQLSYDVECEDKYGRLLAYVSLGDREINSLMVERGYACVLWIPPNGEDRADEFDELEQAAMTGMVGLWGACTEITCD
jgi:micrococcal nuclease